jgi:prepilin-type N-terminal cleavage/methylation domain-containing protein
MLCRSKLRSGLTLIEVMIVIAVIAVLCGCVFPALIKARKEGYRTSDLSKLKQTALSGSMYADAFGEFPLFHREVTDAGLLPSEMAKLTLDPYAGGLETYFATAKNLPSLDHLPSYPSSFMAVGDAGHPRSRMRSFMEQPNAGWCFSSLELKSSLSYPELLGPNYFRVRIDGGVSKLPIPLRGKTLTYLDFFFDSK